MGASDAEIADSVKYKDWGNYELVTSTLTNGRWMDQIYTIDSLKWFPDLKPDWKTRTYKG